MVFRFPFWEVATIQNFNWLIAVFFHSCSRMTTTVPVGTTPDDYISSSELDHVLLVYTDGCCRGNSTAVACPTGWGVTIVRPCPQSSSTSGRVSIQSLESDASKCEIVDELCGPVVLDSACPYYLCASVGMCLSYRDVVFLYLQARTIRLNYLVLGRRCFGWYATLEIRILQNELK